MTLTLFPLILGCQESQIHSSAYLVTDLDETIGGPKGVLHVGDYVIQNDRIRIGITGPRPSMAPHTFGGGLLDADLNRNSPQYSSGHGNDLMAEVFPTVNMNVAKIDAENGEIRILNDGSNGEASVICTSGQAYPFISLLQVLWGFLNWLDDDALLDYTIRTDFILAPGDPVLTIKTYALFGENEGCDADLATSESVLAADAYEGGDTGGGVTLIDLALDKGVAMGDFYLQGGSLDVFTPNIGFDENGYVFELNSQGVNTFSNPIPADYLAGTGDGTSYGIMSALGQLYIPLFTSSQTVTFGGALIPEEAEADPQNRFQDGTQLLYERWFGVGKGDVGSVVEAFFEHAGVETVPVSGFVVEEGTGISLSDVHVFLYLEGEDAPWMEWTTDIGDDSNPDGSFSGRLPVGDYELQVHAKNRPTSTRVPFKVTAAGVDGIVLTSPQPGGLHFTVVDEADRAVPIKLSVFSVDGEDLRDEVLGDGYIAKDQDLGVPVAVAFSPYGEGHLSLIPGQYIAVASRGIEYEIDISEPFEVKKNNNNQIQLQVLKTVDTQGWISADFHLHSVPSHDSGVSLLERVNTMACEGVEYFTPTDHDFITDMDPVIEDLGLERWINSAPGLEVTTIEIGHFLGFPLQTNRLDLAGGAVDWTGLEPQEIIDAIRELGPPSSEEAPTVFVGHPRDGILGYFDEYGLEAFSGEVGEVDLSGNIINGDGLPASFDFVQPLIQANTETLENAQLLNTDAFSTDFDALELLNGKRFELYRTPTELELKEYEQALNDMEDDSELYEINSEYLRRINERTLEEQQDLILEAESLVDAPPTEEEIEDEETTFYTLTDAHEGQIDDWFNLLNLGFRYTALGNSDTHGKTSVESGCPRNYVMVNSDSPLHADDDEISAAVKQGRVITTYGPFVEFYAHGDPALTVGSEISSIDGSVPLTIRVQSPTWFDVNRVELYENGTLIDEILIETPNTGILNLDTTVDVQPKKDSWYVVIVTGEDDLSPVFTTVERPKVEMQDVVVEALEDSSNNFVSMVSGLLDSRPIPRSYPVLPYALTNPIWVELDTDSDDVFTPPGLPDWLLPPPG
jgi:hypothetical protein